LNPKNPAQVNPHHGKSAIPPKFPDMLLSGAMDTSKILPSFLEDVLRSSCIYGIRAKGAADPFYVGSSKQSAQTRFYGHLREIRNNKHKNPHFANKAKKIGLENIEVYEIERVTRESQFVREHEIINEYLVQGIYLTNIRLAPHPPNPQKDYCSPQIIARNIFLTLLAPEKCEDEQNQALYSKLRHLGLKCVNELLFRHRAELLQLLAGEQPV
jgi:hypothetical protein